MDWAFGIDSSARLDIHSSDDRPCYASENPRPKGGTETRFINPDCLRKRGVCPIPAEPVQEQSPKREDLLNSAKQRLRKLERNARNNHLKAMFVEVCGGESGAQTYIAKLLGISSETVRNVLKAAKIAGSGKTRPRAGAREELIPKLEKYLLENI